MIFAHRSFARLVRCTADSDSLLEIADALESRRVSTLIEVIDTEKTVTMFGRRNSANVSGDFGNRILSLTFAMGDVSVIANSLRQLAGKPDRSTITLAALGLLTSETSENNLEFYKLDKVPKLAHDYIPTGPVGCWDGVLYHADPTFEQFGRVREIVLDWAVPDPEGISNTCLRKHKRGPKMLTLHRRIAACSIRMTQPSRSTSTSITH